MYNKNWQEIMKDELSAYCILHWWNCGKKTLDFKGTLKDLMKKQGITFCKRKTDREGVYMFYFKSERDIRFKVKSSVEEFRFVAKQFIQMELVRMGDKTQLQVHNTWRPTVTVNF